MMQELIGAVEKHRDLILKSERFIWNHPETGFKEFETSEYMEKTFESLGYKIVRAEGITGFYTVIDTGKPGPEILILGELDSIICPSHKDANPKTGAVHSCGHNAQCAALIGVAAALREPGILDKFCGRIKLCAVPAEEFLEIEYRRKLKAEGKISYYGGKSEFLSRGYFDSSDIAFMVHTSSKFTVRKGSNGCIVKNIVYKGTAAHAGSAPQNGINALYAANCGLNAINAIRETFSEHDQIRVHPIITHGGDMVNAIPERVLLESYVRSNNFEALERENKKVNRALCGAALSLGANVEIIDIPGCAPLLNDDNMINLASDAAALAIPEHTFTSSAIIGPGSTDMGDLSCIMPVVQPYSSGATGTSHGADYEIKDPVAACVDCAKWQLGMLLLLLENGGARAKKIINEFVPRFKSKEDFLNYIDSLNSSGDRIVYNLNSAEVKLD